MTPAEVLDIGRDAIWVLIKIGMPTMVVALVVGLVISLVQALTQVQETTLTFVPKMLAILLVLVLTLPFMGEALGSLMRGLSARIISG